MAPGHFWESRQNAKTTPLPGIKAIDSSDKVTLILSEIQRFFVKTT
jgi:hypothetical protein